MTPWRDSGAASLDKGLLARTILRDGERAGRGPELVAEHLERFDRQVLELVGGDVDLARERAERAHVVEFRASDSGGDIGGAALFVRVEDVALVAELGGGDGEHPAELAAADDADGRAGLNHSGASATDPVCRARHSSRRIASASS